MPLLLPVPDADAGGDVDVLRVVRAGCPDGGVLRRVGRRCQTQRGLLRGLPARHAAALRQGLRRGQETVGGQRETSQAGLTVRGSGRGSQGIYPQGSGTLSVLFTDIGGSKKGHFVCSFFGFVVLLIIYY